MGSLGERQAGHGRIRAVGGLGPPARQLGYTGGKEEEGYCYRAGGGQVGVAMAFSGLAGG